MVKRRFGRIFVLTALLLCVAAAFAEQQGSIRGMVYDKDFDAPLPAGQVLIAETGQTVTVSDEGNYVFSQVDPGTYTLVFSKEGYGRQVRADVVVSPGQMTEVDVWLSGEFLEMEEFVVQDVQIGTGTEQQLLELRLESPALMDSISSDLMSRAGASDAASALRLVSGTTVQDGKYAVIRGLPDRYVNSQMNGVRLPTADPDKRAVQLDQFPAAVIESIQVTKTFTPDQQGDASGGAVNVVLKGIPEETGIKFSSGITFNPQVMNADNFLSYRGGGVGCWGTRNSDLPGREFYDQAILPSDGVFDDAVGVGPGSAPTDYKWSLSGGGKKEYEDFTVGGFASFFYERDVSYFDKGIDEKYWLDTAVDSIGDALTPQFSGPDIPPGLNPQGGETFYTSLYDVTQSSEEVKWGGLGLFGVETENHKFNALYMYTRVAEDEVTLTEDTRGKEYYFPNYDRNDPDALGNNSDGRFAAPYIRNETLEYTERITDTIQFSGRHRAPDFIEIRLGNLVAFLPPEFDWTYALSSSELNQPDKRVFSSYWQAGGNHATFPGIFGNPDYPNTHSEYTSGSNVNFGNFQRIWKNITEDSEQYNMNLKFPFEQWTGDEGYFKFGLFEDRVSREFRQDTFSNTDGDDDTFTGDWNTLWSRRFFSENHQMFKSDFDVNYDGFQEIDAWYYMADIPMTSFFNIIGGVRFENTKLKIENEPYDPLTTTWLVPETGQEVLFSDEARLIEFQQSDQLPSIGFVFKATEQLRARASYSETVARQTFKELSPIRQMDYLGADVFVGNPALEMSDVRNHDWRLDYTPYEGGLLSVSYFLKKIKRPIEYVQGYAANQFTYTYPTNYPRGELSGWELEIRQQLGKFWDALEGISIGLNTAMINSEVELPDTEAAMLENMGARQPSRDMTNAPEHLYNVYLTYDLEKTGTQFALFYTIRGDTLVAGAGQSNNKFIPSVYEKEYATLNMSLSQKVGDHWKLSFQAKNITDPLIQTIYRSEYIGDDVTKTSYRKGVEFSLSMSCTF